VIIDWRNTADYAPLSRAAGNAMTLGIEIESDDGTITIAVAAASAQKMPPR